MKKLLRNILLILLSLILLNTPVFSEENTIELVKKAIEKNYSVNFADSDAIVNSQAKISAEPILNIRGYGELGTKDEKFAKEAAFADLKRNFTNFTAGISFELNSENDLVLKSSNNIDILKNKTDEKILSDFAVYMVEMNLKMPVVINNYSEKLPSVMAIGFSDINGKKSILEAYNDARNKAIIKGLKAYYGSFKSIRKGKIIFRKILYNSLDSEVRDPDKFVFALQFGIDDTTPKSDLIN